MMRTIYLTAIAILCIHIVNSQIPQDYYDSATGTGYQLKTQLKTIITNGHTWNTNSYDKLYDAYKTSDVDKYYENDNTILDIYTEKPTSNDSYTFSINNKCGNYNAEGDCYNREHLMPKGFFNDAQNKPMVSDIHHVIPTDGFINNGRANYPFGIVTNAKKTYSNGSKWGTGNNNGYTGKVFEPINEFKGDVARAILYFAVRYQDNWNDAGWDPHTSENNPMNGTSDQFYEDWFLNTMINWHNADPVSQREINRNNVAYTFQGNRNPFIDHPEFVAKIWTKDNEAPTAPTNLVATTVMSTSLQLNWTASTDNVGVTQYDVYKDDVYYKSTNTANLLVSKLTPNTNYCFKVLAKDALENKSPFSTVTCETTTEGGNTISDLIISEYVEGSSLNKAIEIANFTGNVINLNNYTIKLASNGGEFASTYNFPNNTNLDSGNVFVIANDDLNTSCYSSPNDTNNTTINFNGNDVIGLFKQNNLIDIIGILGDSSDFAKDVTLIRKNTVLEPNTAYTTSEWLLKEKDDCTNLGTHDIALNTTTFNNKLKHKIKLAPNPAMHNMVYVFPKQNALISVYNTIGKQVISQKITKNNNRIDLKQLPSGVYIIKIQSKQSSRQILVKKLIKH